MPASRLHKTSTAYNAAGQSVMSHITANRQPQSQPPTPHKARAKTPPRTGFVLEECSLVPKQYVPDMALHCRPPPLPIQTPPPPTHTHTYPLHSTQSSHPTPPHPHPTHSQQPPPPTCFILVESSLVPPGSAERRQSNTCFTIVSQCRHPHPDNTHPSHTVGSNAIERKYPWPPTCFILEKCSLVPVLLQVPPLGLLLLGSIVLWPVGLEPRQSFRLAHVSQPLTLSSCSLLGLTLSSITPAWGGGAKRVLGQTAMV